MAVIHIEEIQKILAERGGEDALLHQNNGEGYFLEIRFDRDNDASTEVVDAEYRDKVITLDCPYGMVTILCDEQGQLKSIELS